MKRINSVLYDNHSYKLEDYAEAYEDYLESNNIEPDRLSYQDFINDELERDFKDLEENISSSEYNVQCVIIGYVQLWNGKRAIVPTKCDTVWDAIEKAIGSSDFQIIKQVNGHIEVSAIHHDGTNRFLIHLLNEKGINTTTGNLYNRCYYKAIKDYIF